MNKEGEVFLPPHVVNETSVILPQSQAADWGHEVLNIPYLHSLGLKGRGFTVAVIDTGIDKDHPDLKGAIKEQLKTTQEPYGFTNGHGTGCAGIIGARDNTYGVIGVAPEVDIISIKALGESGGGNLNDIVKAIKMAIGKKVDVINLSLGTTANSPTLKAVVDEAYNAGIKVICAAGNAGEENTVMYPAKYEKAFAIGAINQNLEVSAFSSKGWEIDVAAPGERVLTTWKNKSYAKVSGTSFAAPYVSGLMVLFLEARKKLKVGIAIDHDLINDTAIDIEEPGEDTASGHGLIDPKTVYAKIQGWKPDNDGSDPDTPPDESGGTEEPGEYEGLVIALSAIESFLVEKGVIPAPETAEG